MNRIIGILLALYGVQALAQGEKPWPVWRGWELMGSEDVFQYVDSGDEVRLNISTQHNAAALRKKINHTLRADSTFIWQWQVQQLPSLVAEDKEDTHHYFAVSVIFDNGLNLSYIWSVSLNLEYSFQCPLPDWTARETHIVVESGRDNLNTILSYERNIADDYARFIGGELPDRVSHVWIVALGGKAEDGQTHNIEAQLYQLALTSDGSTEINFLPQSVAISDL